MSQAEIKKFMKEKRLVIGTNQTMDKLRKGSIEKVFTSSNCPERTLDDLEKQAKMSGAKLEKLKINSIDLATLCKKQFSIAVLGVLKAK
jgi:ribosomal protein L30E